MHGKETSAFVEKDDGPAELGRQDQLTSRLERKEEKEEERRRKHVFLTPRVSHRSKRVAFTVWAYTARTSVWRVVDA